MAGKICCDARIESYRKTFRNADWMEQYLLYIQLINYQWSKELQTYRQAICNKQRNTVVLPATQWHCFVRHQDGMDSHTQTDMINSLCFPSRSISSLCNWRTGTDNYTQWWALASSLVLSCLQTCPSGGSTEISTISLLHWLLLIAN